MNDKATGTPKLIPFSAIEMTEEFNARVQYDGIDELAESIKAEGLRTPLTVARNGGSTYKLVSGFRRYLALKKLRTGDKEIPVMVESYPDSPEGDVRAYIHNLAENENREAIHWTEKCRRFAQLTKGEYVSLLRDKTEEGDAPVVPVSPEEIGRATGCSKKHVQNLVRLFQQLDPDVWAFCRKHDVPQKIALEWCAMPPDKQLEAAKDWLEEKRKLEAEGRKNKKRKDAADSKRDMGGEREEREEREDVRGPSKAEIRDRLETLQARLADGGFGKTDEAELKGKIAGLRFCLGEITRL
jgi:ParB-like chromosome segregation protein Spo0J